MSQLHSLCWYVRSVARCFSQPFSQPSKQYCKMIFDHSILYLRETVGIQASYITTFFYYRILCCLRLLIIHRELLSVSVWNCLPYKKYFEFSCLLNFYYDNSLSLATIIYMKCDFDSNRCYFYLFSFHISNKQVARETLKNALRCRGF